MGIVTKAGDKGTTRLLSGEEISKSDPRLDLVGAIDELSASVGFARSLLKDAGLLNLAHDAREVQRALYKLGAEASAGPAGGFDDIISGEDIAYLESRISAYERVMKLPASFVLAGATAPASALDVARARARSLERNAIAAMEKGWFDNADACVWLNRASDFLFVLARAAVHQAGVEFDVIDSEVKP